jgi:NADPH:quinone reductase-like Zn-dependent oxidoreductase
MANPVQLIFHEKVLDGFWLTSFILQQNLLKLLRIWRRAQKLLATELKSEIRVQYPLKDIKTAVQDYQNQMTGGKVLIKPDM